MLKSDKLKLLIVAPGAGSNFLGMRLGLNVAGHVNPDKTHEFFSNRECSSISDKVREHFGIAKIGDNIWGTNYTENDPENFDSYMEHTFPKAMKICNRFDTSNVYSDIKYINNLLARFDKVNNVHTDKVLNKAMIHSLEKLQWHKYTPLYREPVYWLSSLEASMNEYYNSQKDLPKSHLNRQPIDTSQWKNVYKFIQEFNTIAFECHKLEDETLHSIEHYLPLAINTRDKLSDIANICVVHTEPSVCSFVTDILNLKHMRETILNKQKTIAYILPSNDDECKHADNVVSYRKMFYDNDPIEIRKLFVFFDKGEYFDKNRETEIKAFKDYHLGNVDFYVNNWLDNSEEIHAT